MAKWKKCLKCKFCRKFDAHSRTLETGWYCAHIVLTGVSANKDDKGCNSYILAKKGETLMDEINPFSGAMMSRLYR